MTAGSHATNGPVSKAKRLDLRLVEVMPWDEAAGLRVKGEDRLTPRQRHFVAAMIAGAPTASAGYRKVYTTSNMANKTIWDEASRLMAHPVVSRRTG